MKNIQKISVDLGRTLIDSIKKFYYPDSLDVVKRLIAKYGKDNVFIISRVNDAQKLRAEAFLDSTDFYNITGFNKNNLYFCFDRRDKSIFISGLNIDCHVDDRVSVMNHVSDKVLKLIFCPDEKELSLLNKEGAGMLNYKIVNSWIEINNLL